MANLEELVDELEELSEDSLEELAQFVRFLKWKQHPPPARAAIPAWSFDFVENYRRATVSAELNPAGMDVSTGETTCGGEASMALWQHPPVQGAGIVEYQVPVPPDVTDLRLRFAIGIRDGSKLATGNIVAFRVFVNAWKIWSETYNARRWDYHEIIMPAVSGDIIRIEFVTDGLGNHQWAWAAWGHPRLVGDRRSAPKPDCCRGD